ncbi:MAG: sulfurtransferase complex subunit TusC [Spirochaetia bacterium]|nr:sulfurtransferase complex subunit TusC [Spirochaetia bacterium]
MAEDAKKIMFVMQKPPHGSIYPYEGLEFILISGAYEQDISLVFLGDGVYNLKKDQDTSELGIKGFVKTYRTLEGYDIENIYVDQNSLKDRGLTQEDLIVDVKVKTAPEINSLMNEQHAIFPF